jgi:hypothetical protein
MSQISTQVVVRGRQLKFTPERVQQIKNLVERGKSREEIAELIGVTLGSLQVTCSRLGVSLRQPTYKNGTGPVRRDEPRSNGGSTPSPSRGGDSALLQLSKERPEQNSRSGPVEQAQAPTPWQEWAKRATDASAASFAIRMQYRGEERTTELPLTQSMIGQLAFEAAFRNVTIGQLIGQLIVAVAKEMRMMLHDNNAHSQREVNGAHRLLSQATTLLDESRALSYAVVMALAQTPREELSREEIDGLCQLAYELLNKLTKTQEVFQETRQKLRLP